MAVATLERCACPKCSCGVSPESAVKKGGKLYCSVACADGHPGGVGCGHAGFRCNE
jgi:hypothetical protein